MKIHKKIFRRIFKIKYMKRKFSF